MATSHYAILEYRCKVNFLDHTELYVLIDNPTDFLPIGGWYKKVIPADQPSIPALESAIRNQEFLTGWEKCAPDAGTQWQQDEIARLQAEVNELTMALAERIVGVHTSR